MESLLLRGYDTAAVALLDGGLGNQHALADHLGRLGAARPGGGAIRVHVLPPPPKPKAAAAAPGLASCAFVLDADVTAWLHAAAPACDTLLADLRDVSAERRALLASSAAAASRTLWWPFTQHASLVPGDVKVLDSRCGPDFAVFQPGEGHTEGGVQAQAAAASSPTSSSSSLSPSSGSGSRLVPQFDGAASWWTQGLRPTDVPELSRAVAYAAGRWGHVMFAEHAHEAVLGAASRLLALPGAGWASRVFFTDNGATAVEVALKMALRKALVDAGEDPLAAAPPGAPTPLMVALEGSYHGDTLGAMAAQAPSPFTGRAQSPWYAPHGLFLKPPLLACRDGTWRVELPDALAADAAADEGGGASSPPPAWLTAELSLASRDAGFDLGRRLAGPLAALYRRSIAAALGGASAPLAGCVLEPVLHGAGGMLLVDPLYQVGERRGGGRKAAIGMQCCSAC